MKKLQLHMKVKKLMASAVVIIVCAGFVSTAWATLSFMKPQDASQVIEEAQISDIPTDLPQDSKSHAPEPGTLAMFGSGILGMIISFVRKTYYVAKRIFDVAVSIVALVVLSPLFLITALLIKLMSRGPAIYTQTRVGKDGELFDIYKFRTMKVDAEKESGPVWASANDDRLIPGGDFLRKTHIDEIPQFVNVLRGEMSVIGPRPERPVFVDKFKKEIPDYERRLEIKPGITGLAQVWHRYDETIEDVKKKIKYDLLYIKKVCLWTDLRIFFRTFRVVVTGEGAR